MKIISSTFLALTLVSLSTVSFARGVPSSYAPSGHKHHTSHGGHNQGGHGSSHKGGHYKIRAQAITTRTIRRARIEMGFRFNG
jgi:hypothetical protein